MANQLVPSSSLSTTPINLWHHEDVCNVLIDCRGTKKIIGIVGNLPEPDLIPLNPESFLKMVNLELFINHNAQVSGRVDYLPNSLRFIEFGGRFSIHQKHTYVNNLPSNFHPRHLVSFDVSYSGLRQLKKFKNLPKLTWMSLSGCEFLEKKIPHLSGSLNICTLDFSDCTSLVEVDNSVGFLDKLVKLDLRWCSSLTTFATRLGLRSLEELNLVGCATLREIFPYSGIRQVKEVKAASAEWTFLFISLGLEILSLAFDQASSPSKPQYALFGMLLAIVGVLICVLEFIYKGREGRVELRKLGKLWWFYYPAPPCYKPLGTVVEIYGLVGGIAQCVSSIIQYVYFSQHLDSPFKVSLLPSILVICLITSRLSKRSNVD